MIAGEIESSSLIRFGQIKPSSIQHVFSDFYDIVTPLQIGRLSGNIRVDPADEGSYTTSSRVPQETKPRDINPSRFSLQRATHLLSRVINLFDQVDSNQVSRHLRGGRIMSILDPGGFREFLRVVCRLTCRCVRSSGNACNAESCHAWASSFRVLDRRRRRNHVGLRFQTNLAAARRSRQPQILLIRSYLTLNLIK